MAKYMKKFKIIGAISVIALASLLFGKNTQPALSDVQDQWFDYTKFVGFQTKADPQKIDDGANANGQNTVVNDSDRISIRDLGYTIFPFGSTPSTTENRVSALHTFRKRTSEEILMKAQGGQIDWAEKGVTTTVWETLKSGLANNQEYGFSDNNVNTDQVSYVYFGNSQDPFMRWNGAHTRIAGALAGGETTINVLDTSEFNPTGIVIYCGVEQAYSSKTATSFTVSSAVACPNNSGIAQAVETFPNLPRGNIYQFADNRLWISGITSTLQLVAFSQYGSSTVFAANLEALAALAASTTYASPGVFNLAEGGGPVVGFSQDETASYVFKKSIIYKVTLTDAAFTVVPLKPWDSKSQITGAISGKSLFSGGNGVYYVTPDKQLVNLARSQYVDYPQQTPISDLIKPTTDVAVFTSSTGIVFGDRAFFAVKSSSEAKYNDTVLIWNVKRQAWESPVTGWSVGDFAIYDDGNGSKLYFGSAYSPDVYQVNSTPQDDTFPVTASWRSKQFNFGLPYSLKEIDNLYVEGYINPNCPINISLLLDENGYTQKYSTTFSGSESAYLFNFPVFNSFGLTQFGYLRFGSNADNSGKQKFRVNLSKNLRPVPFYTAQVEFESDVIGCQWEIENFAFSVKQSTQQQRRSLDRIFQ